MPGLRQRGGRAAPRLGGRDRGGTATLVSVLLAGGVLLGMTALVVDVGMLYAEREELQSVADSAAFAVGLDCALDREGCDSPESTALRYAAANSRDGLADAQVCGSDPRLPDCVEDPAGNLTDCLNERPTGIPYVEVRATTRSSGGTLLPPSFAQALVAGHEGSTVGACARVAWGAPAGGLAATWSACEWDVATQGGTILAPAPPAMPDHSFEQVISFRTSTSSATCSAGPSGFDAPGAFGWLDDDTGNCQAAVVDNSYTTDPGNNVTAACAQALREARDNRTVLAVPIYQAVSGQGNNTVYTLEGFAGFVVTGYNFPGNRVASYLTGHQCVPSNTCLIGYYVNGLVAGEIGDGPIMGAVVIRTVG